MSDINIVVLQGRLTHNPELRKTPSGVSVCDFQIASNRFVPRKGQEGQFDKYTTFTRITLWNRLAERYADGKGALKTGDMIMVEGQLVDDNYEKDGQKTSGRLKVDNVTRLNVLVRHTPKAETPSTNENDVPLA